MTQQAAQRAQAAVTPYLAFKDAKAAIAFYEKAFGANEDFRLESPDGKISHAEIAVFGATVMLADEHPDFGALSAQTIGGSPVKLHVYVENADAAVDRAVAAGATLIRETKDEFYGARAGMVADPFGYSWFLAHTVEEIGAEEMQRRWRDMMGG